jgi:hypothetical protein
MEEKGSSPFVHSVFNRDVYPICQMHLGAVRGIFVAIECIFLYFSLLYMFCELPYGCFFFNGCCICI